VHAQDQETIDRAWPQYEARAATGPLPVWHDLPEHARLRELRLRCWFLGNLEESGFVICKAVPDSLSLHFSWQGGDRPRPADSLARHIQRARGGANAHVVRLVGVGGGAHPALSGERSQPSGLVFGPLKARQVRPVQIFGNADQRGVRIVGGYDNSEQRLLTDDPGGLAPVPASDELKLGLPTVGIRKATDDNWRLLADHRHRLRDCLRHGRVQRASVGPENDRF
jgi:hypothetical protein